MLTPWKESYDQPRQHITKQRLYFVKKGPSSPGYGFSSGHVWMWELDYKESWAPKNWCFWTVMLEKTYESPLDYKEIQPVHPKENQCWEFIGRTDAEAETPNTLDTWCEELTHLKRPWCWARLKAGGEGDDRGWDGWMASPTQWTWVWVDSGTRWSTGRPGVLHSIGLQRVRHDWVTELNWTCLCCFSLKCLLQWKMMGVPLRRVGYNWATSLSIFTFMRWRRKWQPTPVFLPGESQGRGSLVGCRLWGRTESDTTEVTQQQQ